MARAKKLVVANWKMYPSRRSDAEKVFKGIKNAASKLAAVQTIVCPPFLYIEPLGKLVSGHRCVVGAQDCFYGGSGDDYTGEISAEQLKESGVRYIILGHSERRAMGETDKIINMKVTAALKAGLQVILCVGESKRDNEGHYLKLVRDQLRGGLSDIPRKYFQNLTVAYEPIWAISTQARKTGAKAEPLDAQHMRLFVKRILADIAGVDIAERLPVLYGGSVNPRNAESFLVGGEVDGFLVGSASERVESFREILKIAANAKN